ncbi:MAG: hypothetical protein IJZ84_03710 [Lachnospiraceae bacterium]|nr:hypothetical protein [Lachnospiraceae bacterium]
MVENVNGIWKSDVQQEDVFKEKVETTSSEESVVLLDETKLGYLLEEENEPVSTKPVVIEKNISRGHINGEQKMSLSVMW